MATWYVYSGGDNSPGYGATARDDPTQSDNWSNAFNTLAGAAGTDAAGDTIYVADDHSEDNGAAVSYAWASSGFVAATWSRILVVNRTTGAISTGALVKTTGNYAITTNATGQGIVLSGITFFAGSTASSNSVLWTGQDGSSRCVTYYSCTFKCGTSQATNNYIIVASRGVTRFVDCWISTNHSTASVIHQPYTSLVWTGGGVLTGSVGTVLVTLANATESLLSNLDLTNAPTAINIFGAPAAMAARGVIRNSNTPASWSGNVASAEPTVPGCRVSMYNCDTGATVYRMAIKDFCGSIVHYTAIYLTATNVLYGATAYCWQMVSNANANLSLHRLESDEIVQWFEPAGSPVSKTVTVEILMDAGTTLYTGDVWLEVSFLNDAGYTLETTDVDSRIATILTANTTECTTGAGVGSWSNETGGAKSYKLVSTITPKEKGFIQAKVVLAKASTTIYVDPWLTVA
jgi:hypothetical protein